MRIFICLIGILMTFSVYSQVGIGTSSPKAQLDIVANSSENPSSIDGILIPRIDKLPTTNPGEQQHGMLVFLNTSSPQYPSGFYFWNFKTLKWETISGNAFGNFYKPGTSSNPNNITDYIYRTGSVGIGTQEISSKLQIALNSPTETSIKKALEIDNNNPATDNFTTYGIINDNRSATNGNKYGIKNNVGGIGNGIHYGIFNETYQNAGTNDIYGIYNRVGKTFGANSDNYGIYSEIGQSTGLGKIYGIYSAAYGNNADKVYAGYFAGRLGIGNTFEEQYIFPSAKGSTGQSLYLESTGNMVWTFGNVKNYSTTGSATGDFIITDDVYTLRINNEVSRLVLPAANTNRGRMLILIGWDGIGSKQLVFTNSDNLYDIKNNTTIASISGNQVFTIQSAGNRWILLDK
ncbi:hypothetical protein L1I30_06565 [Gillisia sp. M10.2A]|uniref:Uncharacterized protein n=1 Tax=Gillisia lutea TaxID=2909668 RepID=A0ABS9EEQ0_9FLAO|nr:hypothetical protein [Gillisia lutea]MCF4101321.1 hypothetical protein [Gillisia lutea]